MMTKPEHEIWYEPHGEQGPEVRCSCGWRKRHAREKVRAQSARRHLAKVAG